MNPDTGAIAKFENDEDAKAAGHTFPLTNQNAAQIMPLSRKDRRKAAAAMRRAKKKEARREQRRSR